jgi:hypothetical protein
MFGCLLQELAVGTIVKISAQKITNLPTYAEEFSTFLQSTEVVFGLHIMLGTGSGLRVSGSAYFFKCI